MRMLFCQFWLVTTKSWQMMKFAGSELSEWKYRGRCWYNTATLLWESYYGPILVRVVSVRAVPAFCVFTVDIGAVIVKLVLSRGSTLVGSPYLLCLFCSVSSFPVYSHRSGS